MVRFDEAIRLTELVADKIETFAKQHSDRICFFGGNHPVVCLAVAPRLAWAISCQPPRSGSL